MKHIPISGPWITDKEISYVTDAVTNAWFSDANIYNERFELAFSEFAGVRHAVSLPSCTSGIHLALAALGIGPGDEVIVPDVTWIASVAPVSYVGATPIFVDIDPITWCIQADSIEKQITENTKAIIAVDLYGSMPNWDEILAVAKAHGIPIIEDAAEAIGSTYHGKQAGSLGLAGVFSFHGSKTITTGEGGMLITNDTELFERVLFLRDHGRPPGDRFFYNTEVAFKYKMSSMQAALGLAQLERIEEIVDCKREVFSWYQELLGSCQDIVLNVEPEGTTNSYWMVTAVVSEECGLEKKQLMDGMKEQGVDCRPFFHPLSSIPAFHETPQAVYAQKNNLIGKNISRRGINLPSAPVLTYSEVEKSSSALLSIMNKSSHGKI